MGLGSQRRVGRGHPAHAGAQRRDAKAHGLQSALKKTVLLEAIAAAPRAHQFLKHGVGGEIDGFRAERIKPLKRDAGRMAAVQRL